MKQKGFSLIELLIAMAVIGILSAVAFPAYNGYVQVSRRADAKAALLAFANALERSASETNKYTGWASGGADTGTPLTTVFVPPDAITPYYAFTIAAATETSFTLLATPKGAQATDACGKMTITNTAATGADGTGCW